MQDEKTVLRLRYLMLLRVAFVTFLLGIATFLEIKGEDLLPEISLLSLYLVIITSYILSLFYFFLLNLTNNIKITLYIQAICDVLMITGLVYATGGISSLYAGHHLFCIISGTAGRIDYCFRLQHLLWSPP